MTGTLNINTQTGHIISGVDLSIGAPDGIVTEFKKNTPATPISNPAEGTAANGVLGSGTIDTTIYWQRVTTAGAVTGVILEAGVRHGQRVLVSLDKDAGGTITMAAAGTSRVGTGTACVIAVGAAREFIWDNTDLIWCELGET